MLTSARPPLTRFVSKCIVRHALTRASEKQSLQVPFIETCPQTTCECKQTPAGLDIDQTTKLSGTAPRYARHLILSTGHASWPSRIEDDGADSAVSRLRSLLGRGGRYFDPYHNVMISNSSIAPTRAHSRAESDNATSALIFPGFKYIPYIPLHDHKLETLVKGFLLPSISQTDEAGISSSARSTLQKDTELQKEFPEAQDVQDIIVLICGHGARDRRCGILGPLLVEQFRTELTRRDIKVVDDAPALDVQPPDADAGQQKTSLRARVALISHVGGHKWAGNVIIYVPPTMKVNGLAGSGIWYGRVEPKHVQGIVAETILGGRVIRDMFRGGIDQQSNPLYLS